MDRFSSTMRQKRLQVEKSLKIKPRRSQLDAFLFESISTSCSIARLSGRREKEPQETWPIKSVQALSGVPKSFFLVKAEHYMSVLSVRSIKKKPPPTCVDEGERKPGGYLLSHTLVYSTIGDERLNC